MEKTSRIIIYNNGKIPNRLNLKEGYIFIKRTKYIDGKENIYYTVPGGHVEENETFKVAGLREIKEELNIEVEIEKELFHFFNEELKRDEVFYLARYKSGNLEYGNGPEFVNPDLIKYGKYEIVSIKKEDIDSINLLPKEIKKMI